MKKTKMVKRAVGLLLAFALTATSVSLDGFAVKAAPEITAETTAGEAAAKKNFAKGATATASDTETGTNWTADKAVDGVVNRDAQKAQQSRWSTNMGTEARVLTVNLGSAKTFDEFKISWERENIKGFKISVSDDGKTDRDVYTKSDDTYAELETVVKLENAETAQYVKLTIDNYDDHGGAAGWPSVSLYEFEILGAEDGTEVPPEVKRENLALGKEVTASNVETGNEAAKAVDGNSETRWATNAVEGPQTLTVNLGETKTFEEFKITWERENVTGIDISVSDTKDGEYTSVYEKTYSPHAPLTTTDKLATPASGQYVKLTMNYDGGTLNYKSVSLYEFEIWNVAGEGTTDPGEDNQDPQENIALRKAVYASSEEADSVRAENAVDGNTKDRGSRWGSNTVNAPHWILVDLGETKNVQTVRIFWENRKATAYRIQTATELTDPSRGEGTWKDEKVFDSRPKTIKDTIVLDNPVQARYVRLYIDSATAEDPDGGVAWNSVSIYEMEVYGGVYDSGAEESFDTIKEGIVVEAPKAGDKKLKYILPESEKFEAVYNGTDYEQVIDADGTIYQPIVDTTVKASFKITEKATGEWQFKEVSVTVPGKYQTGADDNAAPQILPELREWKGNTGNFTPTAQSRIVIADAQLQAMAEAFQEDYKEITGRDITIVTADTANDGDFFFALTTDKTKGLKDEGYLMTVEANKVSVEAEEATGAYWATRTILQSLKLTKNIPCGIVRDYPLFRVRGYILDVGRKTFTMDYLKQVVKQMSWYKMNDFHVHLNDNLIFLEDYAPLGKDPMTAYSGFRLESDIKEGGNGGKNKADLTSKDVFYTKNEFRSFIEESRAQGVNIVPEFDSPAHALALTKVRPDLRHSANARDNEHLALNTQYNECLDFVQSIFNEYMTEQNPVFDEETVIHIGADEYSAGADAYRNFVNDMFKFVQDSGRTPRVWGSLSSLKGTQNIEVRGDKDPEHRVQMNLWNYGWAKTEDMYDLGFDLIFCGDGALYIVPNSGYYHPLGISSEGYYNVGVNNPIPAGDKQSAGAAFAIWNDQIDIYANGVSEYDVYKLTENAFPMLGARLWGKGSKTVAEAEALSKQLGDAPNTNFGYDVPAENGVIKQDMFNDVKDAVNAVTESVDGKTALKLNGGESYVTTELETVGLGNDLRIKVKRTTDSKEEQILLESPYGSIKAVQKETGKVGFSREGYDYSFDYELPVNEWVELEFKNTLHETSLYVNGKLAGVMGDDETVRGNGSYINELWSTMMFPVERIGSKTNAFEGYVDDLRVGTADDFHSTMKLDYAVVTASALTDKNAALKPLMAEAEAIFGKFAPTEKEIDDLTSRIQAEIEKTEFEKADYSRVEAYLALVPEDMSVFTEESAARVQMAVEAIRYGLPAAMQSTVDGFEKMLADALASLELKTEENVNYVPSSQIQATASSKQDGGSAPEKALDDDLGTIWHTQWNKGGNGYNPAEPHWFNMRVGRETGVNGLTYIPRSGGGNGTITNYKIVAFNDGEEAQAETVAEGTWKANGDKKVLHFDKVNKDNIRIQIIDSVHKDGSAAEFKLHKADVKPDIEGLKEVIESVKAIENKGYTEASWNALQEKIREAEELAALENADANAVEVMKKELLEKRVSLVLEERENPQPPVEADKKALNEVIEKANALNADEYTEESWKAVADALKAAEKVSADKDATEQEVKEAADALWAAIDALKEKEDPQPPVEADKKVLNEVIKKAKALKADDYTKESWKAVADALKAAEKVSADKDATGQEVKKAADDLQAAIDALKKKDNQGNGNTDSGSNNSGNQGGSSAGGSAQSGNNSAQTGDNAMTTLYAALVLAAAGIFLTVIRRRRNFR